MPEAFLRSEGELFVPNGICRGPWDPTSLHGRVVAGLLAHEIERRWSDPAFRPARLTVDLYRMPRFAPIAVRSELVRDGNRIRIVDAEFISQDRSIGRASCVFLRTGEDPGGTVWSPAPWDVRPPESYEPAPPQGEGEPIWDMRTIDHGFGAVAQKRTWMRETRELVQGVPLTPFLRAAVAADFASPFANSGDQGLQYVNADISLYLHRLPVDEWLGFEVVAHDASDGIAVGECRLYDRTGPIGRTTVCALAQRMR